MNRKELLNCYYNKYGIKLLKPIIKKLLNSTTIEDFSNITYHKSIENFKIDLYVKKEYNKLNIEYYAIDMISHFTLKLQLLIDQNTQIRFKYHADFEDEELNQMLKNLM